MAATEQVIRRDVTGRSSGARKRHRTRYVVFGLFVLLILLITGTGAVSWYFSDQLLAVAPNQPSYDVRIFAVQPGTVTLASTSATRRDGVYGLDWPGGRVVMGRILSQTPGRVTRRIVGTTTGLKAGMRVDFDVSPYASPVGAHLPYRAVRVLDPLGAMPAWYIPGRKHTWVILVHGWKSNRADGLKITPTLARLGFPVLDISYRNDTGAPASSDYLYHLGATEWQDVEAGVRYALAHGARNVILYGFSMGGAITESFLRRSQLASRTRASVLDSPPLDWSAAIDLRASKNSLPGIVKAALLPPVKQVVAWRIGLASLDSVNQVEHAGSLRTPRLIFHGTGDTVAPVSSSIAFARAHPRIATLYTLPGVEHTQSWNARSALYERRLVTFLDQVMHKP